MFPVELRIRVRHDNGLASSALSFLERQREKCWNIAKRAFGTVLLAPVLESCDSSLCWRVSIWHEDGCSVLIRVNQISRRDVGHWLPRNQMLICTCCWRDRPWHVLFGHLANVNATKCKRVRIDCPLVTLVIPKCSVAVCVSTTTARCESHDASLAKAKMWEEWILPKGKTPQVAEAPWLIALALSTWKKRFRTEHR